MEKTNKIVEKLNIVFDTICIIYDETELCFDSAVELITKFRNAYNLIAEIDIKECTMEIWDVTSKSQLGNRINNLVNYKFDRLLTWKPYARDIAILNLDMVKDLELFFDKQLKIRRSYIPDDRLKIQNLYFTIGHRLLKASLDLEKVKSQLMKMQDAEADESEEISILKLNNLKLQPDKTAEFGAVIKGMFDNNFFIPIDNSVPFSKTDVLNVFGDLLHANFDDLPVPANNISFVNVIENQLNGKGFADYLLHKNRNALSEGIKKEFSTDRGKSLRLLIHVLENNNPPLITVGYRQAKDIYKAMCLFFNRDIGTYQSIFNVHIDENYDLKDIENTKIRLNHILNSLEE